MSAASPIRVLIVSPCFGEYGGIEAFAFAVAGSLRGDARFEVRVCFKRVAAFAMRPSLEPYCATGDVVFCDRASAGLWSQIAWADVVHAQHASPDIALFCALQRKPLAVTIHDFLPKTPRLRRLSWIAAARLAAARWYNSAAVWDTWEPGAKSTVSARVPTVSRLPRLTVEPADRKGFVFVGRLVDSKGVDTLLDAYVTAGLNDRGWPLTIIGDGPMRPALEKTAIDAGLGDVRFLGFVDDDTKARCVAGSKWLIAPSRAHEGLGLVVVEARHAGVPCIITSHGGLPEAGGRDALVCVPASVVSLAAALKTAAAMPGEEYEARRIRTKQDLSRELVPMSFYADAYQQLLTGRTSAVGAYRPAAPHER